ncbi:MAG: diaminopimelate decarboxylase [Terriglobales bacterium]
MSSTPSPSSQGRPPAFTYRATAQKGSTLHCDKVPLTRLAERFGTPLYVYSAFLIRERMRAFDAAFRKVPHTVCYSVKANSNLNIMRMLARMNCGFDVVSGGELGRVLRVSRGAARKVVFSGVGKTREEMRAALKANILLFNVESESELRVLAKCAEGMKKKAQIALRVNPDVPADTHPYISTGLQQHKFGIPIAEAVGLYEQASKMRSLRIGGISVHIGSQITDLKPFTAAMERVADLVKTLRAAGHTIKYVDAGGGLGIPYRNEAGYEFADCAAAYAEALLTPLRGLDLHLLLEPGRCIVGPAGVLLTRVLYKKTNGRKRFLVVDAGMNDLLRPSLYSAYHEILPVSSCGNAALETVDVVGPVCETGDFFARDRELPVIGEDDLLAVLDAGAYGTVLTSNYNTRPRPAEVLVNGAAVTVIRRRETLADLVRQEAM